MPALDLEKRRIIQEGYQSGLAVTEIARLAGITPKAAMKTASRMDIRHPNGPLAPDDIEVQDHRTPQYRNWQRARKGAAETLKRISK